MRLHRFLLSATVLATMGCTTIKSTILQRDECNMSWQAVETKGIPITLEVPTHLQVTILDTAYYYKAADNDEPTISPVSFGKSEAAFVSTDVRHSFLRTKKVFTVDPKHACAGDHEFRLDLAEDKQYLKKFESDVTDRTIEETSMAFERLLIAIRPGTSPGVSAFVNKRNVAIKLSVVPTVRAVQIFNIDDPMFEQNVTAFIAQHLPANCATDCQTMHEQFPVGGIYNSDSATMPGIGEQTILSPNDGASEAFAPDATGNSISHEASAPTIEADGSGVPEAPQE